MLTLPIKKKWFEMILSGEKKEEYRDRSRYYHQRFWPYIGKYKTSETDEWKRREVTIRFRNGYSSDTPSFVAICTIDVGQGTQNGAQSQARIITGSKSRESYRNKRRILRRAADVARYMQAYPLPGHDPAACCPLLECI